jgi:hypothetical protein
VARTHADIPRQIKSFSPPAWSGWTCCATSFTDASAASTPVDSQQQPTSYRHHGMVARRLTRKAAAVHMAIETLIFPPKYHDRYFPLGGRNRYPWREPIGFSHFTHAQISGCPDQPSPNPSLGTLGSQAHPQICKIRGMVVSPSSSAPMRMRPNRQVSGLGPDGPDGLSREPD